jgi:hypothetical protein
MCPDGDVMDYSASFIVALLAVICVPFVAAVVIRGSDRTDRIHYD